jgi:outer membrane protein insertion porin family
MRFSLLTAVLCIVAFAPDSALVAQIHPAARPALASASDHAAFPVESISIEGNEQYTPEQILAVAQLKAGQMASKADFEAAYNRLQACGAFSSVGYRSKPAPDGKGYTVRFEVIEAGPFFPVRFEDLGVDPAQLVAALQRTDPLFGEKIPATQEILTRYSKAVEAYLVTLNRSEKVLGKLLPDETGEMAAVFRPSTPVPVVARVLFTNNEAIAGDILAHSIDAVALGVPYREPTFRRLLESSVRPLYEQRGRVRVAFPEIGTEKAKDVDGLVITVKVDEGASYSLGDISIEGSGLSATEALNLSGLKKSDIFNADAIDAGIKKVEHHVWRQGYLDVKSVPERHYNDAAKTVDLAIRIEQGPRYVFGSLIIKGLDILSEPPIRKAWGLKAGQPFNSDYPDSFLKNIREEEIFDNLGDTKAVIDRDEKDHSVAVTLIFKGAPPKTEQKRSGGQGGPPR